MAEVQQAWKVVMNFIDTGANQTIREVELTATDDAGDMTDVLTAGAAVIAAWVAATDAVLTGYSYVMRWLEASVTLPSAAEVENNIQVSAKITGKPNKSGVFEVPAPKSTCVNAPTGAGFNQAKFVSPSPLIGILNTYASGAQALISDGETLNTGTAKGKRVHHKSNKG